MRRLKLRFRLLADANFTCQYCGRSAPDATLHIDHRIPRAKGGLDEESNYVVACSDCNVGKQDVILNPDYILPDRYRVGGSDGQEENMGRNVQERVIQF